MFLASSMVIIFITWFGYRRRFDRKEEVNATGDHKIYYREGSGIFYKLYDHAITELENGNKMTAKELFEQFIKLEPNNAMGYVGLGQYYLDQDILEAQKQFQQAYNLDSKLVLPLLWLGNIAYQRMQFHMAIGYFDKAITLKRNIPELYLGLANCYDKLNNATKALQCYKKFLRLAHTLLDVTEVRQRVAELSHNEDSGT